MSSPVRKSVSKSVSKSPKSSALVPENRGHPLIERTEKAYGTYQTPTDVGEIADKSVGVCELPTDESAGVCHLPIKGLSRRAGAQRSHECSRARGKPVDSSVNIRFKMIDSDVDPTPQ